MVWCLAWKGVKTVNTLENLYYGNIDPHEHTVSNGTDKGEFLETVVRLETELRATLTEQQKALLEQLEKADAIVSDRHELQAFTIGFRLAARLIGWLCIPDTQLNYPVMYTPENPEKYLRRNFYGEYSQSGVLFLDWRCGLQSDHLIVYGHNMKNGTMFSSLRNYTDPAFCAEHPIIEFQTANGVSKFTVFAVAAVQKDDAWYSFIHAAGSTDFSEQTSAILQKSLYDTGVTPVHGQQIITLSTCHGSGKNGRLIVAAVKM